MSVVLTPASTPARHARPAPPSVRGGPRRFPVRLIFALMLVALALSPVIVVGVLVMPHQSLEAGPTTTYAGLIGGKPASLTLTLEADRSFGYFELSDGREILIEPDANAPDSSIWRASLLQGPGEPGTWSLELRAEDAHADGTWRGGSAEFAGSFSFQAVATTCRLTRVAGFRTSGDLGRDVTYSAVFPRIVDATPFDRAVEVKLRREISEAAYTTATWPWSDWEDLRWTLRETCATNSWFVADHWYLTYRSDRLISMCCRNESYTGGAHGNTHLDHRVFWWNGRDVQRVELSDLFRSDSDWQEQLLQLCIDDLESQRRERYEGETSDAAQDFAPTLDWEDLSTFTVHPAGLRFHFAPYVVGCYVEGSYEVFVPWSAIRSLLMAHGPASALPIPHDGKEAS
jgi:hypothetical protein